MAGMALVDGEMQGEERELLLRSAKGLGINREQAGSIVQDIMGGGTVANLQPPSDPIERGALFQSLVDLIVADGEVSDAERVVLERLAGPFGVDPDSVQGILQKALKPAKSKVSLAKPAAAAGGAAAAAARPKLRKPEPRGKPKPQLKQGETPCPSCGAPVEFRNGRSVARVCEYCDTTVVREEAGSALEDAGKISFLVPDASPIQIGARGEALGAHFTVLGRLQIEHETGFWNEWYIEWADRRTGWLGEALGQYFITLPTSQGEQQNVPDFADLEIGERLKLMGKLYTVTEARVARATGTEGETPFVVKEGYNLPYADLRRSDAGFATIDYSEDEPLVFVGRALGWSDLGLRGHRRFDGWDS